MNLPATEKFERIKNMPQLKKEIISYLFDFVSRKARDQWWKYIGEFNYEGETYDLECECKWDNTMFTFRNLYIARKQIVIEAEDFLKMDLMKPIK